MNDGRVFCAKKRRRNDVRDSGFIFKAQKDEIFGCAGRMTDPATVTKVPSHHRAR